MLPNIWKCCILSKKMVESTSGTILDRFCMCKIGIYVLAKHSGVQLAATWGLSSREHKDRSGGDQNMKRRRADQG